LLLFPGRWTTGLRSRLRDPALFRADQVLVPESGRRFDVTRTGAGSAERCVPEKGRR
jgi:hypothetical protein